LFCFPVLLKHAGCSVFGVVDSPLFVYPNLVRVAVSELGLVLEPLVLRLEFC
jgi:hypothetical protein